MKNIFDLINYKKGHQLYKLLHQRNHNNLIIYGPTGIGKTCMVKVLLNDIFKVGDIQIISNLHYTVEVHPHYYYFDCMKIKSYKETMEYINNITRTYNHYTDNHHYLVFDHFEESSVLFQNYFKVVTEKLMVTCRFLFITNNLSSVVEPIKSRCLLFRIPTPYSFDKYIYLVKEFDRRNIYYNKDTLYLECIHTPLHKLHDIYIYGGTGFIDIEDDILKNICKSFAKPIHIASIRKHCNFITELNINLPSILRKLVDCISHKYEHIDTMKLIHVICEYDLLLKKSYRDIIYLESLIIKLYRLINGPI